MRFERTVQAVMVVALAIPAAVWAHPGHVHQSGPVHGYSWIDLLGLLVIVAVPLALVWLAAHRRDD